MNWEAAIQLFTKYKKDVFEMFESEADAEARATIIGNWVRSLVNQMPLLAKMAIEDVTSAELLDSLQKYAKANKDYINGWNELVTSSARAEFRV